MMIYPVHSIIQLLKNWGMAPVVEKVDNTICWINHNPVDSIIGFPNMYPVDGDLSGGQCYPTFKQLRPGL